MPVEGWGARASGRKFRGSRAVGRGLEVQKTVVVRRDWGREDASGTSGGTQVDGFRGWNRARTP